jgi:hypothetical protein
MYHPKEFPFYYSREKFKRGLSFRISVNTIKSYPVAWATYKLDEKLIFGL